MGLISGTKIQFLIVGWMVFGDFIGAELNTDNADNTDLHKTYQFVFNENIPYLWYFRRKKQYVSLQRDLNRERPFPIAAGRGALN
ncbi:MAG: hypothetical protein EZS26_002564 [Candidatus Ordinivivax streblomastigis]|uniref:Uncharacterized protein n=1 Tax=Candidatus Ordinivivax streblomastigis TaxID=2540710 RepID=A0A5M8NYS3_9BACT|nr:MAG: hypothetical protein EZS26_002564 [Candidatus Ordinivivax streblomastigis]